MDSLGFELIESHTASKLVAKATGFSALYRNSGTGEVAQFIGTLAVAQHVRKTSALVLFKTAFADGTEVMTSNNRTARIFPPLGPPVYSFNFPQVEEAARLLGLHRSLVGRFEGGRIRRDPAGAIRPRISVRSINASWTTNWRSAIISSTRRAASSDRPGRARS